MSFTNYGENLLLNWAFTATGTAPASLFIGLHIGDPTETGDKDEVLVADDAAYTALAGRKAITFGSSSIGQCLSASAITHTPDATATAYTVTHISVWDAQTDGNCIMYGELAVPRTIDNANPLSFAAGNIVAALE